MSDPKDCAFPNSKQWTDTAGTVWLPACGGLTKREYFVAQALRGCIEWDAIMNHNKPVNAGDAKKIVKSAIAVADAALKELAE